MPRLADSIRPILDALAEPHPVGSGAIAEVGTFAALIAAFLSRAGDERSVIAALAALREAGRLDPEALAGADPAEVEDDWRASGAKGLAKSARTAIKVAGWAAETFEVDVRGRLGGSVSTEALRDGLRAIKGVGPATADAILLEGLGRPAYPVDRATYRILVRHGWLDAGAEYDEARAVVEGAVGDDPEALRRLAAGFDRLGREACRASVARCDRCPLRPFLPEGGPLGEE